MVLNPHFYFQSNPLAVNHVLWCPMCIIANAYTQLDSEKVAVLLGPLIYSYVNSDKKATRHESDSLGMCHHVTCFIDCNNPFPRSFDCH